MNGVNIEPINSTMMMHPVFAVGGTIAHTETCFCDDCLHEGKLIPSCSGWMQSALTVEEVAEDVEDRPVVEDTQVVEVPPAVQHDNDTHDAHEPEDTHADDAPVVEEARPVQPVQLLVRNIVAALYDGEWSIGKVLDLKEEEEAFISLCYNCEEQWRSCG